MGKDEAFASERLRRKLAVSVVPLLQFLYSTLRDVKPNHRIMPRKSYRYRQAHIP